ncbi:MAG: M1 family metallopeptidase [Phycisphaerales bacterium]
MKRSLALTVGLLALIGSPVCAQVDPRIDTDTGAEQAHYPPPRHFDHLHMKLAIDIPDMSKPALTATETLTVSPIGRERRALSLNAVGMDISAVAIDGRPAKFTHDQGRLDIAFDRPIPMGKQAEVRIDYTLDLSKGRRGQGLSHVPPRTRGDPGPTDAAPLIFSHGQPEYNRRWFPCHDFPNERLTTELIVTVEDGFTVVSNGRLLSSRPAPTPSGAAGAPKRTTWHWLQDQPHANYLVTLVVGKFAIVGLPAAEDATPRDARGREVPCFLYAPIGSEKAALRAFGDTPAILAMMADKLNEPYPWDKYAQVLVRGFSGGMENTSATTMMAELVSTPRTLAQSIIVHEAAHQWFGDLITCKSWEHAWLNEGWASYCEALWVEHAAAPERRAAAYQRGVTNFLRGQSANRTTAPGIAPLASSRYDFPMQNFMKANDIYGKGALVLHMLRMKLGDDAFWKGVRLYVQRHRFKEVETDDFRKCLEEVSGLGLERFFQQWCYQPGMPRVEASFDWKGTEGSAGGELTIALDQKQHIDADNPAYALSFPIHVKYDDESSEWLRLDTDATTATRTFALKARPEGVELDPDRHNGIAVKVAKPLAMWLKQAQSESIFAQLEAVEHLGGATGASGAILMLSLAADARRDPLARAHAIRALAAPARPALAALRDFARPFVPSAPAQTAEVAP